MWSGLRQPSPLFSFYLFTVLQLHWLPFWSSDGLNSFLPAPLYLVSPLWIVSMWLAGSIPSLSNLLYCHLLRISDYSFQSSATQGIPNCHRTTILHLTLYLNYFFIVSFLTMNRTLLWADPAFVSTVKPYKARHTADAQIRLVEFMNECC